MPSESPPKVSKWVVEMYQWKALPPLLRLQVLPHLCTAPPKADDSIKKMANNQKSLSIRVEVTI